MFRLLVVSALASVALAAPFGIQDVPEQYRELIPAEAKEFFGGLTDADKAVLKEVAMDYAKYKTEDDALNALKEKSPALHEKASKLHAFVKGKVDALGEEAQKFAKAVIADARSIQAKVFAGEKPSIEDLKGKATALIAQYKTLSEGAKTDLATQFPILTGLFKNEKFKAMADKFIGTAN